jgi:hypothetical protein
LPFSFINNLSYLRSQLEQYKSYLQNVRGASAKEKGQVPVGVTAVGGKEKKQAKAQLLGPYRFTHAQFEKEGIILESNVPENRCVRLTFVDSHHLGTWARITDSSSTLASRANIYFNILSPSPGTFIIGLHYKGRDKAILEMDLGLDDLLEKVRRPCESLVVGSTATCADVTALVIHLAKGQQRRSRPRVRAAQRTQGACAPQQGVCQAQVSARRPCRPAPTPGA